MNDLSPKEQEALKIIRDHVSINGKVPSIRKLGGFLGYKSPNSPSLITNSLIKKGFLSKKSSGDLVLKKDLAEVSGNAQTVSIPFIGQAACGSPILAEEMIEAYFPVSTKLASSPYKYFLLRAVGDSMNLAGIQDGDLVLVRQQQTAQDGQKIVALIDGEATIKEIRRTSEAVILLPRSTNQTHKPIILTDNFLIQGVVITTIPNIMEM